MNCYLTWNRSLQPMNHLSQFLNRFWNHFPFRPLFLALFIYSPCPLFSEEQPASIKLKSPFLDIATANSPLVEPKVPHPDSRKNGSWER